MLQPALLVLYGVILRPVLSGGPFNPHESFNCPQGRILSDQNRTGALTVLNGIRSSVALGTFRAQSFLPSGSNLVKLAWDCGREELAEAAVRNCIQPEPAAPSNNARNYHFFAANSPPFGRMFPIQAAMLMWSEVSSTTWPSDSVYDGTMALHALSNMIRANTTAVGCSGAMCSNGSAAACVFSQPEIARGNQIYMPGMACTNDAVCMTMFSPNPVICENGLCVNGTRPPTATTTTTSTTTTSRRRSTDCTSRTFSSAFRETALGMHNNFRSLVARGLARNGEYANENAPPASRMDLMEYDCNAEQLALNHVRMCDRREFPAFVRPGYSENIHVLGTTTTDILGAIQNVNQKAIATFINELRGNGIPSNMILAPHVFQRRQRMVTRVSKVVWGSNRFVGCATQRCNGFYFTSCMYRNPVNVVGANIYNIGAVCSACPTGPNNCNPAIGLCSY